MLSIYSAIHLNEAAGPLVNDEPRLATSDIHF